MTEPMEKKPTNANITKRYLQAMRAVISTRIADVSTKKDFAEMVGITPQRLNAIEKREDGFVTAEQAATICSVFGVSPAWVLIGKGSMFTGSSAPDRLGSLEARVASIESQIVKKPLKTKSRKR